MPVEVNTSLFILIYLLVSTPKPALLSLWHSEEVFIMSKCYSKVCLLDHQYGTLSTNTDDLLTPCISIIFFCSVFSVAGPALSLEG